MLLYASIMCGCAALFLALGFAIWRGHTGLIHDYHQTHIPKEKLPAYGRAFSGGMFSMSLTFLLTGVIPLFGDSRVLMTLSTCVMVVGFAVSFVIFARVQKKYNGGFF